MKLYCFGESGHSYKAALALQLANIDWDPIFLDFFNGEARSDQYRSQINEKTTINYRFSVWLTYVCKRYG
jgi:glutathione S-transferase